ncbi:hypothetical protein FA13DRAFT_1316914 [Coprinellus micaceus]|uniref:Uncharacterized protein n=1 Tax=Coprinellus micaceus TaxID=71717 RepID=A0A4Y7SRW3_COPMI|nr:hypothetical protein FA13DRAFT_1316914 [Coprinellus micaceus]
MSGHRRKPCCWSGSSPQQGVLGSSLKTASTNRPGPSVDRPDPERARKTSRAYRSKPTRQIPSSWSAIFRRSVRSVFVCLSEYLHTNDARPQRLGRGKGNPPLVHHIRQTCEWTGGRKDAVVCPAPVGRWRFLDPKSGRSIGSGGGEGERVRGFDKGRGRGVVCGRRTNPHLRLCLILRDPEGWLGSSSGY